MIVFDGEAAAAEILQRVKVSVDALQKKGIVPHVAAVLFQQDIGSQLYSQKKSVAAQSVSIEYSLHSFSFSDDVDLVLSTLEKLNQDSCVTGIIIQKPTRKTWEHNLTEQGSNAFSQWWHGLYSKVEQSKDVDGLHPETLQRIKAGKYENSVKPATVRAVEYILEKYNIYGKNKKIIIVGKSDLLGYPLFYILRNAQENVELIGKKEMKERQKSGLDMRDADVVVSATGVQHLVTASMLKDGVSLIDVGEPRADIDPYGLEGKAAFLSPVPGGVGPVTIACLMENVIQLCYNHFQ